MKSLFDPVSVGDIDLPNRIIMAPLTRCRAVGEGRVPNKMMAEYYVQRASAGLIISEATSVSPQGVGYPDTPGIWSEEQVIGWRYITEKVHQAGGRIVLQLWHVGRVSDPIYLHGDLPVGPSALPAKGHVSLVRPKRNYIAPRALETTEIPGIVNDYLTAASNAKLAGFDGVEIHAANGYLLDQFLQSSANKRTDRYGGALENRARLLLNVVDAVISVWGERRVGVHLSPNGEDYIIPDADQETIFTYVAQELDKRNVAFIVTRNSPGEKNMGNLIRRHFHGFFISNERFDFNSASSAVAAGRTDAVAFGKLMIANPDLVARFMSNHPLNIPDPETFMTSGPEGYIDYQSIE
ncbi:alkene reductase [Raoultella sp. WB_B2P2-3]|uniref:Alkene reductase n=1 Tax=Raoultella scottii TaxID=3040937 RepID=A0ABU8Z1D2_9ENTR